jgi:hypothetical protein
MTDAILQEFYPDGVDFIRHSVPMIWNFVFSDANRCPTPYIYLNGSIVTQPTIALCAVGGIMTGVWYGILTLTKSKKIPSATIFYALSFFFFAGMNFSGLFFHSLRPPPLYVREITAAHLIGQFDTRITRLAHVGDVCCTACSCISFIIGRLYEIRVLNGGRSYFYILLLSIFALGSVGIYHDAIPFTSELLYPGILSLTFAIVPFLKWPVSKYPILAICMVTLFTAFAALLGEIYLCRYLGPYFTAPTWCFLFCVVTFHLLARLIDIQNNSEGGLNDNVANRGTKKSD